jgi:hypothetical protein
VLNGVIGVAQSLRLRCFRGISGRVLNNRRRRRRRSRRNQVKHENEIYSISMATLSIVFFYAQDVTCKNIVELVCI